MSKPIHISHARRQTLAMRPSPAPAGVRMMNIFSALSGAAVAFSLLWLLTWSIMEVIGLR